MGANAQTSVPAFTSGQVLTAAQVTQINTGIPVFASSTERDAAFGGAGEKALAEGQMAYLEDTNETQVYDGSAWGAVGGGKILQVVSTTKVDMFSTSSTSFVDITDMSLSITPSSTSSKILVMIMVAVGHSANGSNDQIRLLRDSTGIFITTAGSFQTGTIEWNNQDAFGSNSAVPLPITYLDSPATTSATTYKLQAKQSNGTLYINRSGAASNAGVSSITLMEVAA